MHSAVYAVAMYQSIHVTQLYYSQTAESISKNNQYWTAAQVKLTGFPSFGALNRRVCGKVHIKFFKSRSYIPQTVTNRTYNSSTVHFQRP